MITVVQNGVKVPLRQFVDRMKFNQCHEDRFPSVLSVMEYGESLPASEIIDRLYINGYTFPTERVFHKMVVAGLLKKTRKTHCNVSKPHYVKVVP